MDFPLDFSQHPCFNAQVRHSVMRIHLPVAPRCNVQCNFCTRRFDCVNESRPGVTQAVLTPEQALHYLETMAARHPQIKVVGIAGPGDPFANPEETMTTLRLVRSRFPQMLLCLASNGFQVRPYVPELAELKVSHVSMTVNAVRREIAEGIYSWVRSGKRVIVGPEAAALMVDNQLDAISALKAAGILVKINTVVIEGVNSHHVLEIADTVKARGADILNPMPMYANHDAVLGIRHVPSLDRIRELKRAVAARMPVMHHCTRCRADAVGLLGARETEEDRKALTDAAGIQSEKKSPAGSGCDSPNQSPDRPLVAVATREGLLVDQHLGEATVLWVFRMQAGAVELVEKRIAPPPGGGDERWHALGNILNDCSSILVSGVGPRPAHVLAGSGLTVHRVEGLIRDIVPKVLGQESVAAYRVTARPCGEACRGAGNGCG